jgi:hypothetical protein
LIALSLICLIREGQVIRLPSFKAAKSPWNIDSERHHRQYHDQQPISKKADTGAMESQPPIVNKRVFGNPALLCGIRPGEKQAEGNYGQHPSPNKEP